MFDLFTLANARLMVALNHWVASSPSLYKLALHVTDKFSDLLTLATFAVLWFWPQAKEREYLQAYPDAPLSFFQKLKLWPRRVRYRWMNELTREESRAQFLVLGLTGVLGYVTARLIAFELNAARPFATVLPIRAGIPGAFEGLRTYGSFPSDHAVLLTALPVALFFWDRTLAYIWIGLALFFATARVAVGFHSPLDMAGGALIGVLYTYGGLWLYRKRGAFGRAFLIFARGFELRAAPYCFILYVLVALGSVEFAMHFQHVLDALFAMRGELLARFSHRG
jgi:membrane-associated phospholipid phosphatase